MSWCVQDGSTPLHYAAAFGQTGVIRTLMASGCPVDATDDAKNTPLHLAAGEQSLSAALRPALCMLSISAGGSCCPNRRPLDGKDWPSLAGCGFIETVDVLVELGADINARDITACTPLQNAAHGTYSALAAMPTSQQPGMSPPQEISAPTLFGYHMVASRPGKATTNTFCPPAGQDPGLTDRQGSTEVTPLPCLKQM